MAMSVLRQMETVSWWIHSLTLPSLPSPCLLSVLPVACVSGPAGSTLVLRQDEEVQATRPGVPERQTQTGAFPVQQGK